MRKGPDSKGWMGSERKFFLRGYLFLLSRSHDGGSISGGPIRLVS